MNYIKFIKIKIKPLVKHFSNVSVFSVQLDFAQCKVGGPPHLQICSAALGNKDKLAAILFQAYLLVIQCYIKHVKDLKYCINK